MFTYIQCIWIYMCYIALSKLVFVVDKFISFGHCWDWYKVNKFLSLKYVTFVAVLLIIQKRFYSYTRGFIQLSEILTLILIGGDHRI